MRLVDGDGYCYGRLEICFGGEWGTVCDDYFDYDDLTVACYQLGFSPYTYWTGTGASDGVAIFLDDMNCNGCESRLEYCCHPPVGTENCSHGEDVTIYCTTCKYTLSTDCIYDYYVHFRALLYHKIKFWIIMCCSVVEE